MYKKGMQLLLGMLFVCGGGAHAGDAPKSPATAVGELLTALNAKVNVPSLYGRLEAEGDGYHYAEYRSASVPEEPWVDIFNSKPAWDSKGRHCVKRLIGKDTCPESRPDLFRKSSPDVLNSITGTVLTLGLKPLFGKMPWDVQVAWDELNDARRDAESRLDHDAFKALVERYQAAWKDIIRFENDVKSAITGKTSEVSLAMMGFDGGEGVRDDFFYDVMPSFPWRVEPLQAGSLEELVLGLEILSRRLADKSQVNDIELGVICPGSRLQHLIKASSCDISAEWDDGQVVSRGHMEVTQWKIPETIVLEYSTKGEVLAAEFENGLLSIVNVSDSEVSVRRVDFMNAGGVRRQPMAQNSIKPGKRLYYSDMITNGTFARALEEGRVLKERHMDDEEQFGVRVFYTRAGGSATVYLTEKMTVKDIVSKNIQSLQERGSVLEDVELYQMGIYLMRYMGNRSARDKLIELVMSKQDRQIAEADE
ncbi:hypothetical protein MWU49_15475 [Alcanivorax sp. S6407]|uniref:hypothetical protein n=1 Tax=Alcanivorax sp. S6407 TaxID=2926424 RepID=UPI001FF12482|nr:hypothetical protein [Alcanivorax sp. S6407]MCK0155114.1 hypothetical protein [Alcanivorax sp. S6407]